MNWLNEQYANERYQQALREAVHDAEINALLDNTPARSETRRLRQTLGGKLIEWGKRLQETPDASQALNGAQGL